MLEQLITTNSVDDANILYELRHMSGCFGDPANNCSIRTTILSRITEANKERDDKDGAQQRIDQYHSSEIKPKAE